MCSVIGWMQPGEAWPLHRVRRGFQVTGLQTPGGLAELSWEPHWDPRHFHSAFLPSRSPSLKVRDTSWFDSFPNFSWLLLTSSTDVSPRKFLARLIPSWWPPPGGPGIILHGKGKGMLFSVLYSLLLRFASRKMLYLDQKKHLKRKERKSVSISQEKAVEKD